MPDTEIPEEVMARAALQAMAAKLAEALKGSLPKEVGFALILTDIGDDGSIAYASSVNREDMVVSLLNLCRNIEQDMPGRVIRRRTDGERLAYHQGNVAAYNTIDPGGEGDIDKQRFLAMRDAAKAMQDHSIREVRDGG